MVFVFGHTVVVGSIILLIVTSSSSINPEISDQFSLISGCVCSGYEVTYTCSVVGGGNTIWKGSAFDCPSNSDSNNNQILLRHSGFGSETNSMGMCNNGDIIGEGIQVIDTLFISELRVTVSSDVVGKQVACYHENGVSEILIGNSTIVLTNGSELSPPTNVSLTEVSPYQLVFNWMPVTHNCSSITYNIISSTGCGDCPTRVNDTNANCLIEPLIPSEKRRCVFGVRAFLCDDIRGEQSDLANLTLAVPQVPVLMSVIPTYFENKTLQSISVTFMEPEILPISDTITGLPNLFYTVIYTNSTSSVCHESTIQPDKCVTGMCKNTFDVLPSDCSDLADIIYVTIFATNDLGNGSTSDIVTIDESNNFVNIKYIEKVITCTFINQQPRNGNILLCKIKYESCKPARSPEIKLNGTVSTRKRNELIIPLEFTTSERLEYCYTVTANNGTLTVNVYGRFSEGNVGNSRNAIIGGIIGGTLIILVTVMVTVIIIILIVFKCREGSSRKRYEVEESDMQMTDLMFEDIKEIDSNRFKIIEVDDSCEVTTLMKKHNLTYQTGCVYYQFTRKEEKITGDKSIIFRNNNTKMFFESMEAQRRYLVNDSQGMTTRPTPHNHTVFVQSKGFGARQLVQDTLVLYDINMSSCSTTRSNEKPVPVKNPEKFKHLHVSRDCSLIELIEDINGLKFRQGCAYFEFTNEEEDITRDKQVILMRTEEDNKLYTGEGARHLFISGSQERGVQKPTLSNWKVFVQSLHLGYRHLAANTLVLYEEPKPDDEEFVVIKADSYIQLDVPTDCRLKHFIKQCPNLIYDDLTSFYFEFTSKAEHIPAEKGVILMNADNNLFTGEKAKEMIGAPNRRVNNPHLKHYRVFVQDGGAGTRFLKANSILLYKKPHH